MTILNVDTLRKSYGDKIAVDGLSFAVQAGEIFGLLGPNGAGKSTTIALCVGLLEPDSGTVRFGNGGAGREVVAATPISDRSSSLQGLPTDPNTRRRIGVAPQALALYEDLTAQENLQFFGRVHGLSGLGLGRRVEWALELASLVDVRFDRVSTFSGGMKRRLNLAVAVLHEPEIVFLDEPTAGVDPQSRNAIFDRVEALRDAGLTVIYTTHYMEEAQRLCDRIAIVDHGRLLGLDTVPALISSHGGNGRLTVVHEGVEQVLSTNSPVEALNAMGHQHRVETFRYQPPSLEGVFLNLTGRELRD